MNSEFALSKRTNGFPFGPPVVWYEGLSAATACVRSKPLPERSVHVVRSPPSEGGLAMSSAFHHPLSCAPSAVGRTSDESLRSVIRLARVDVGVYGVDRIDAVRGVGYRREFVGPVERRRVLGIAARRDVSLHPEEERP